MYKYLFVITVVFSFIGTPSHAGNIDDQDKVGLQLALMDFMETNERGGAFTFFDTTKKQLVELYPANLHPMIVPADGYYFLCADFRTASGKKVDVDFVVVPSGNDFHVVQTMLNQRSVVREIMKANK